MDQDLTMRAPTTRGAEGLPRRAFTVADVDRMIAAGVLDPEEKFELLDGELVPMAAQATPHFMMKSRIGRWFGRNLSMEFDVGVDGTVKLTDRRMFEPDIVVAKRLQTLAKGYFPIEAALLVIEVADSSLGYDRDIKAPRYAEAGVPEYWVVDLNARGTLRMRAPAGAGFEQVDPIGFDAPLSPLFAPELALRIADLE